MRSDRLRGMNRPEKEQRLKDAMAAFLSLVDKVDAHHGGGASLSDDEFDRTIRERDRARIEFESALADLE